MIAEALASAIGVTAVSGSIWSMTHSLSAGFAVLALAVHIGLHGSWITHTLRGLRCELSCDRWGDERARRRFCRRLSVRSTTRGVVYMSS